ncbi:MAG TPA: hypothetical protein VN811_04305 [Thermoanaerobaculia bacterium]|nr:hypothetical protein [Thermoanaerobaculia bacterium]HXT50238.1 hypothetical protein [Thermoanaerobaculia bacterium]
MDYRPLRRLAALALLASIASPLPLLAAKQPGADSPQALVARLKAAAQNNDFPELVDCIAPKERREMAAGLVLGTTMMVAFMDMGGDMAMGMAQGMAEGMSGSEMTAEQKAEMEKGKAEAKAKTAELRGRYDAILQKYGLKDRMEAMQAEGGEGSGGSPEEAIGKLLAGVDERALITDLMGFMNTLGESQGQGDKKPIDLPGEVTDYKIQGDHATAKAGDETVRFVKVDGRWYFEPSQNSGPGSP